MSGSSFLIGKLFLFIRVSTSLSFVGRLTNTFLLRASLDDSVDLRIDSSSSSEKKSNLVAL